MSLSWRDPVRVFVSGDEVRIRLGGRSSAADAQPCALGVPAAEGCVTALRSLLARNDVGRARVEVVLSNQLVRYALVPDADLLRDAAERQAAAMHSLAHLYGEAAAGWRVAHDMADGFLSMVAAGVDAALLAGLESVLKEAGARSVKVRPALELAINAASLPRAFHGWLAVLEPGRILVASVVRGSLVAMRSHRIRSDAMAELQVLLNQSRLLDGMEDAGDVIVCAEPAGLPEMREESGWRMVPLDFTATSKAPSWRANSVRIDFGTHRRELRPAELVILAAGVAALSFAFVQYGNAVNERASLQRSLAEADRFTKRQGPALETRGLDKASTAEVQRANAVVARLSVPWDSLFMDIESAAGEGIALTGFEPEAGLRRLRIQGEARRFEDLTRYLGRLENAPSLQNVFLTGHEARDRGLTFTLTADWIRSDEAARP
ncbi:hypothetical protein EZ313_01490 [Ramlibacter henchirensis]|uniref:PilN domain-containing protein n=1 Tax=Ramlibacter henchirensis TaxID=204072 RepID=A0A4Z0C3G3_9BURK|nr:PilN domain-containing protein [Ramlibacter henchirensis]TFZ05374.1 hypothetical protein EZ313_01490 [Ramlibacter henchirensis]